LRVPEQPARNQLAEALLWNPLESNRPTPTQFLGGLTSQRGIQAHNHSYSLLVINRYSYSEFEQLMRLMRIRPIYIISAVD
jgi:hypothetical protein